MKPDTYGNRSLAGVELRPNGQVYVLVDDQPPLSFSHDYTPETFCPAPLWEQAESKQPSDAVLVRVYGVPPILHVMSGVDGVQSWEADDGLLHVFVSPQTHSDLLHRAHEKRWGARVLADVRRHKEGA